MEADPLEIAREAVALAEKATKGAWIARERPWRNQLWHIDAGECKAIASVRAKQGSPRAANVALIAHAGTHYGTLARALLAKHAEVGRLREALEFYAPHERYQSTNRRNDGTDPFTPADDPYYMDIGRDYGKVARAALAQEAGK